MASKRVAPLVAVALTACNSIAGYSELEKVSCAEADCVTSGVKAAQVSVGRKTTCAILSDRTVACWGANPGKAPGTVSTRPVKVPKLAKVDAVSIGLEHACAVDDVGTVSCWGRNENGQLGDGTTQPSPEPKVIGGLPAIDTLSLGATHSCAHTSPDVDPVQGFCWGHNDSGQLGNGTTQDSSLPIKIDLGPDVKIVRLGAGAGFTCAIVQNAQGVLETWCWGRNDKGQCGQDPAMNPIVPKPTKIDGIPQLERVYPGASHVCSRVVGERVAWCWGANDHGQLGINATSAFEKPREVLGTGQMDTTLAGARHTCLVKRVTLDVTCWGANDLGQFAGEPSVDRGLPGDVPAISAKESLAMRQAEHGCQVKDGAVTCWGANDSGQVGNGKTEPFSKPAKVTLP